MYVGIVLQALVLDFYPRLVGVATDNSACNRLINEQTHVSMLLAGPGVVATMALAPVLVTMFYSSAFAGAIPLVQWICMGMVLRVIAWPMGMLMLAKDTQRIFIASEFAWTSFSVVLAWTLVDRVGLNGAGFAFFGAEVFHTLITYLIARHLSGFRWDPACRKIGLRLMAVVTAVMVVFWTLPTPWAIGTGVLDIDRSACSRRSDYFSTDDDRDVAGYAAAPAWLSQKITSRERSTCLGASVGPRVSGPDVARDGSSDVAKGRRVASAHGLHHR